MVQSELSEDSSEVKAYENLPKNNKLLRIIRKPIELARKFVTVEPLVICYVTTKAMCEPAFKNLELEKSCRVNSLFNSTVCNDVISGLYEQHNFTRQNDIVQSHITRMHSWQLTTSNIITIILILLVGSYSDRYKIRRLFILTTLFGQLLALVGCILCVQFMNEWPLEALGFCQEIIYALFGGDRLLLMLIYAYVTDISTPQMRTVRVAIIQALWNLCYTIGQSLSGALLHRAGYMLILLFAFSLCTLAFLYGTFLMKDSRQTEKDKEKQKMLVDIFNPQHIVETFKMFKRYKETFRINIVCLLVIQYIYSTVINGENSVFFLFTQAVYEWTIAYYSYYMSVITTINSFNLFFIVPFCSKVLHFNDLAIIMMSFVGKIIANIIFGTMRSLIGLYVGAAFAIFRTVALVGIRSQITKYVSKDDVGKILSICVVIDSFGEGTASQIYNNGIYEHTRTTFPQAFFLLAIVLYFSGMIILIWMYVTKRATSDEDQQSNKCLADVNIANNNKEIEITHL
ncbi:hypothetical protein ILUMI_25483 [Ignelater luminosus]|uniref:Uncharacterized protein n=1 Tax=Ignelater luminosus TaxID=2038154 RepID=A0A8K0FZW8_IGNLU|nr:hypothetical protein ILUMI_25483 [Ignelater luminosus]